MKALVRSHLSQKYGITQVRRPRVEPEAESAIVRETWISGNERIPVRLMAEDHIRHTIKLLEKHPKKFYKGFEKVKTIEMFRAELERRQIAADKFLRRFSNYRTFIETPKKEFV